MKNDQWTSKIGFILAVAGSAIGLGAIWKFPYMAGTNGGAIFFLLFLLLTIFIGAPILIAEFIIGRASQKDAISSFKKLVPQTNWYLLGYMGVLVSFILLSFYSVVGGWILSYLWRSITGSLTGLSNEEYGSLFSSIISSPYEVVIVQLLFMLLTILVVQGGIQKGIEKASKYMMPALFVLFLILVFRSVTLEGATEGITFLLKPNFMNITSDTILMALGQSFFALSVGILVMVTYASYLSKKENITKSAYTVVGLNILISLLAGLVIFPAVFAFGFEASEGPGLVFVVLPAVFNEMFFGGFFLFIFLLLLLFATLTSAFSILEIVVAAIVKGNTSKRKQATWVSGFFVFLVGIPSALSFGVLSDVQIFNKSIFDFADFIVTNLGLPLGALFISLFVGYKLPRKLVKVELENGARGLGIFFDVWYFSIRFIVPIAISVIFVYSLGWI